MKNGNPHGHGMDIPAHGALKYQGEFVNGLPEGKGELDFEIINYKSNFRHVSFNGEGVLLDKKTGKIQRGNFQNGELVSEK